MIKNYLSAQAGKIKIKKYTDTSVKNLSPYKTLYYFGNKDLLNSISFTIVGSRKITSYGKQIVSDVCKNLANYPVVTVSGYVDGVDFETFKQSLLNNIPTIMCLGYGFNHFNKTQFLNNYSKISQKKDMSNVLILSQFEPSQNGTTWTFPKRDSLLASVGKACLVVEAAEKSGTFYTVKQCFKENKPVLAVPNGIYAPYSKGTNMLIKKGFLKKKAQIYTEFSDISKALNFQVPGLAKGDSKTLLSKEENAILNALTLNTNHFNDIAKATKISANKLSSMLTKLEIMGFVKKNGGGYIRVK